MLPNFNFLGTTLFLVCFMATGLTFMTGIGWMQVVESTGRLTISLAMWLYNLPRFIADKFSSSPLDNSAPIFESSSKLIEISDATSDENSKTNSDPLITSTENKPLAESMIGKVELSNDSSLPLFGVVDQSTDKPQAPIENASFTRKVSEPVIEPDFEQMPSFSATDDNDDDNVDLAPFKRPIEPVISNDSGPNQHQHQSPTSEQLSDAISAIQPKVSQHIANDPVEPPTSKLTAMPSLTLLDLAKKQFEPIAQEDLDRVSRLVEAKLLDFNIIATVVDVFPGPVITRFELDLAPGIKVSKISGLSKDLARSLSALSVRVVEVIPGKSVIGLEIPNENREIVYLRENLSSDAFINHPSPLAMVLGKDIAGDPVV
ncbi:MAG: cell division protein FtsK, partial [Gammaproteobacteria bacterium]|nr:cell division protein FtsK [Gammaproteobacteria bacterium]